MYLAVVLAAGAAFCRAAPPAFAQETPSQDSPSFLRTLLTDDRVKWSLSPVLAYEPTFGIIYGGAVFAELPQAPRFRLTTRLAFSTRGEMSGVFELRKWRTERSYFHFLVDVDDFARPYYGEGMDTDPENRIFLEGSVGKVLFYLNCRRDGKLTRGPFLDFRGASLDGVDGDDVPAPVFDETSVALGYCLFYDSRDSALSPTTGVFDTLSFRLVPESLSDYENAETFLQAEVDSRLFYPLGEGATLAVRIHAGGSWGRPTYHFRYSIGGAYELRGFYTNRFRGDKFYVAIAEVRKDLFWVFSGAAFAGLGEASDDEFHSPEGSYGAGIRFTLPPDNVAKARLDFAWAKDQKSVYFIFQEAF